MSYLNLIQMLLCLFKLHFSYCYLVFLAAFCWKLDLTYRVVGTQVCRCVLWALCQSGWALTGVSCSWWMQAQRSQIPVVVSLVFLLLSLGIPKSPSHVTHYYCNGVGAFRCRRIEVFNSFMTGSVFLWACVPWRCHLIFKENDIKS